MKDLLVDEQLEDEEVQEIGRNVATRMKGTSYLMHTNFPKRFEEVQDEDEFNDVLDDLYNYADVKRIWID